MTKDGQTLYVNDIEKVTSWDPPAVAEALPHGERESGMWCGLVVMMMATLMNAMRQRTTTRHSKSRGGKLYVHMF